ncbi:UTRA domain-containing protein [Streptomyces rubiginosohelvolus]|uniref:UTRA domain-containing protein n=1 Tax=Streptomyces rubiginosohelvolus TaxID=67362 RepID=UPI00364FE768
MATPQAEERLCARLPTPAEAATLRISPTLAVLAITRVATDTTGRVVEAAPLPYPATGRRPSSPPTTRQKEERPKDDAPSESRPLPWSGPDGKPSSLSTDGTGCHLSRLADRAEAAKLDIAAELLEHAQAVLADESSAPEELRLVASDLADALRDALRVAASRGHRLPTPGAFGHVDSNEVPNLPAGAFG